MKGHWMVSILASILILGSLGFDQAAGSDIVTGVGTLIGNTGTAIFSTEIECTPDGSACFSQGSDGSFSMEPIDPTIPIVLGPAVFTGSLAFNGLEYVGATLYGTGIIAPCTDAILHTVDPLTGVTVPIGPALTGRNISGLAYDGAIMYGVDGCGSLGPSNLYTINLITGEATSVGSTGERLASLEFGFDGNLYAGGDSSNGGNIYRISTFDGSSTLLGLSGFGQVTGLTLIGEFEDVPVGGTIFPIDSTALLVAGSQTISPWLILGVLSAVGIGLAVFTIKRSR